MLQSDCRSVNVGLEGYAGGDHQAKTKWEEEDADPC